MFNKFKQNIAKRKNKKRALNFRRKLFKQIEIYEVFVGLRRHFLTLNDSDFKAERMKYTADFIENRLPYLRNIVQRDLEIISETEKLELKKVLDDIQEKINEFYEREKTYY